jgi:ABC-type nitrate/sulfonate/bicarbonate transport system substrate-binding protein
MPTRRRLLKTGLLLAAAPAILRPRPARAGGTLNVGWMRQFAPAGVVQKEADIAKEAGLTVNLINFTRGLDGLIAMQKGDIEMTDTLMGYSQFCVALGQGIDVTMVAGTSQGLTEILIAPKQIPAGQYDEKNRAYTGLAPWELLRGKAVGGARGSQQEFVLRYYLREHGMSFEKDIRFIDLKANTDQSLALRQGSIDAACVIEPTAMQARIDGYAALLDFGYDKNNVTKLNAGLLGRTAFIKQNRDVVQTMVDSHVKALTGYKADRAAWVKDTAAVTLFKPDTLGHLLNPAQYGLDPKYWYNLDISEMLPLVAMKDYAKSIFAAGFVAKDVSDQIDAHVDYSFLEKATGRTRAQLGG